MSPNGVYQQTPLLTEPDLLSLRRLDATPLLLAGSFLSSAAARLLASTALQPGPAVVHGTRHATDPVVHADWSDAVQWVLLQGWLAHEKSVVASDGVTERARHQRRPVQVLDAVADLAKWLNATEDQIAKISGFSRRSLSNWRRGDGVYPKTVRRLFEVHALLGALYGRLGPEEFDIWLSDVGVAGMSRRTLLSTVEGFAFVRRQAQSLIFEELPRDEYLPEYLQAEIDDQLSDVSASSGARRPSRVIRRKSQKDA